MTNSAFLPGLCYLALLIFYLPGTPGLRAQETGKPFPNSRFATTDSVTLHFRTWNDSLPEVKGNVVLIHGFCGSTFCWRENIEALVRQHYRVVAVDLPGFGYSSRNLSNQSFSNRARILWDFLALIGKGDTVKWNIVGHSMGGGIAEAMALMEPGRTRSLVLVDGMVFLKNQNLKGAFITSARIKGINQLYISIFENKIITDHSIRRLLRNVYGYVPDSSVIGGYKRPLLLPGTSESVIDMFAFSKETVPLEATGLSSLPVLLIWGKKDHTIYPATGKKLKRAVPSVQLEMIPRAHHSPMETHPSDFNPVLVRFLNSHQNGQK